MSTLTKTFRVDGILTDMGDVYLSSADEAYGIRRNDTGAVVIADGTQMTAVSTGVYVYTFTDPAYGLSYTYVLEFTYGGETHHIAGEFDGPTAAPVDELTLAEQIAVNAAGPKSVTVDGQTVVQHSLADQIAADKHAKANAGADTAWRGLRFTKLRAGGP